MHLPEGLLTIGSYAFQKCDCLNTIIFPASLLTIGDRAFYRCTGLGTITFPLDSKLETIGISAFAGLSTLTGEVSGPIRFDAPPLLSNVGYGAFMYTRLLFVTFGCQTPVTIGDFAFSAITQLMLPLTLPVGSVTGQGLSATPNFVPVCTAPSAAPTQEPTHEPTQQPTSIPTNIDEPSPAPSPAPTAVPTSFPTVLPGDPTMPPQTAQPTPVPSAMPSTAVSRCVAGEYLDIEMQSCQSCGVGKYNRFRAQISCEDCPAGKASNNFGASQPATCVDCLPGTFSAGVGAAECSICAAGTVSSMRATECMPCPAGHYSFMSGSPCEICPSGKYSLSGFSMCKDCTSGSAYSAAGASSCNSCG